MVQGVFTKSNRRVFLIVLLIVALVSIGAAVGSFLFFGRSVDGNDLTEGFGSKLSYGNSFSLKDITEEEEYKYEWINANGVDVKVYALNADGESVETDGILAYSKEDHSFEVIGVSSGTIRFTSVLDDTVTFSVSFTTSFASPDTEEILAENYPHFFEDGIITRSELMEIRSLRIESRSSVDL